MVACFMSPRKSSFKKDGLFFYPEGDTGGEFFLVDTAVGEGFSV